MFARPSGSIQVHKGQRLSALQSILPQAQGLSYVLHLRFATHGDRSVDNTHPFRVTRDMWLAHNGIVPVAITNERMSDTWHFARLLTELSTTDPKWLADTDAFRDDVGDWIGPGNKIAFLRADGKIIIANEQQGSWEGARWYSNTYSIKDDDYDWKWYRHYRKSPKPEAVTTTIFKTPWEQSWHESQAYVSSVLSPDETWCEWKDEHTCENCGEYNREVRYYRDFGQQFCPLCSQFFVETGYCG